MITTILSYLPCLGAVIAVNILLGVYYNVETLKRDFSISKLISGTLKALIIALSFMGVALVFDKMALVVALGAYELKPDIVLFSAILLYLGKDMENLMNILGLSEIDSLTKEEGEIQIEREEDEGQAV